MKRQYIVIVLWFCIILGVGYLFYCTYQETTMKEYAIDHFMMDLGDKGYEIRLEDIGKDDRDARRIRMHLYGEILDVYCFTHPKKMEAEAEYLRHNGSGYSTGGKHIEVGLISNSHFYKKGNIIVQYVGHNLWTKKLLEDILGVQFVGHDGEVANQTK